MDKGELGTSGERQTQVDQTQVYSRASRLKPSLGPCCFSVGAKVKVFGTGGFDGATSTNQLYAEDAGPGGMVFCVDLPTSNVEDFRVSNSTEVIFGRRVSSFSMGMTPKSLPMPHAHPRG